MGLLPEIPRKLRRFIKAPLLRIEQMRGPEPKADFNVGDGTDFVCADPAYDLGITGAMKIAHLVEAVGLDVELHAPSPAHRHCMAAIRNTNFYALALVGPKCGNAMPPVYVDACTEQLDGVGNDGCFPVPDGPGLGVTYDRDYIKRHRTQLHEFKQWGASQVAELAARTDCRCTDTYFLWIFRGARVHARPEWMICTAHSLSCRVPPVRLPCWRGDGVTQSPVD